MTLLTGENVSKKLPTYWDTVVSLVAQSDTKEWDLKLILGKLPKSAKVSQAAFAELLRNIHPEFSSRQLSTSRAYSLVAPPHLHLTRDELSAVRCDFFRFTSKLARVVLTRGVCKLHSPQQDPSVGGEAPPRSANHSGRHAKAICATRPPLDSTLFNSPSVC